MADLPSGAFVAVNDIETAQGAPVSEAVAQKYGSNENNLDARITSNDADIATNVTNIATNATNISSNDTDIATNVTNIATNVSDIASNASDIITNAAGIATNVSNIAAIKQVQTFTTTLTLTGAFQTLHTFSSAPVVVNVSQLDPGGPNTRVMGLLTSSASFDQIIVQDLINSSNAIEFRLTGTLLEARISAGSSGGTDFAGFGF